MKALFTFILTTLLFSLSLQAQQIISGYVVDRKGNPLPGANIFLKNTYDGATSNMEGNFSFTTSEKGEQLLIIRYISFETQELVVALEGEAIQVRVVLKEAINKLDGVTITAGAFGAGDGKRASSLKPMDIVSTAGALGDIANALQTMPGTQTVAEDGRLFVRGGSGEETQVFIDGLYVQNPYNASLQQVPTRGRFSPFMFKGTLFSTGGYSAEYGQAMSSVLLLDTKDVAVEDKTDISLMSVGAELEKTIAGEKQSFAGKLAYTNLAPYMGLVKQNLDWHRHPEAGEASIAYRRKDDKEGLLKIYGTHQYQQLSLSRPLFSEGDRVARFGLSSRNTFLQLHYQRPLGKKTVWEGGASYTSDLQEMSRDSEGIVSYQNSLHLKSKWVTDISKHLAVNSGAELFRQSFSQQFSPAIPVAPAGLADYMGAVYIEADAYLSSRLLARAGGRMEYSNLLKEFSISPRFSLAWKTNDAAQLSFAYGTFYQKPQVAYLLNSTQLNSEQSSHYILNYQYSKKGNFFRIEGYYKNYDQLIRYTSAQQSPGFQNLNNDGYGYAGGMELFWRNKSLIRNAEFWISYSFLDTRRLYRNMPVEAVPHFASAHNLSLVYKHFVPELKSMIGGTWNLSGGRPYHNPNKAGYQQDFTPGYRSLNLNWAYLFRQNIIFYTAATNILGAENISGYEFADRPGEGGSFASRPISPAASRFLFAGVFITLTKDKKDNQLDRL